MSMSLKQSVRPLNVKIIIREKKIKTLISGMGNATKIRLEMFSGFWCRSLMEVY